MIHIQNLSRRYGETVAVHDFSVDIERGEIVGLLGHNGAGKTTVMKVLTGFLEPSSGTVALDGRDVVRQREEVQRKLGYLPENAPLYPEMIVQDYLLLMAELRGVPEEQRVPAVARAVLSTGLEKHLLRPISELSRGFRQRVGIAQAIVHQPEVLILDEPTNGLDPMQIQSIRDLIRQLGRENTIILSTHILQEVEAVCDRVLVMINGQIVEDAPLAELLRSDDYRTCLRGDSIAAALSEIPGVREVRDEGTDEAPEGFRWWHLVCAPGTHPGPEIVKRASARGWTVEAVAREHRTLEAVFRKLQEEHARRIAEGAAAPGAIGGDADSAQTTTEETELSNEGSSR